MAIIRIEPGTYTLVVNITKQDGSVAAVYTDSARTNLATFPASISTGTSWHVAGGSGVKVSTTYNGVEIASSNGTTVNVFLSQGGTTVLTPVVDLPVEIAALGTSGGGAPAAHASTHAAAGTDPVTISESQVANLTTDLAAKAPLASPALTGTPTAPTPSATDSSTKIATTARAGSTTALAADGTNATTSAAVGIASPTLPAGTYSFQVQGSYMSSSTSAGMKYSISTSGTATYIIYGGIVASSSSVNKNEMTTTPATLLGTTSAAATATPYPFDIFGTIVLSVGGVVNFNYAASATGTITLQQGSNLRINPSA